MTKSILKFMIVIGFCICSAGCFSVSTRVSTIGVIRYHIETDKLDSIDVPVTYQTASLNTNGGTGWGIDLRPDLEMYVPYRDWEFGAYISAGTGQILPESFKINDDLSYKTNEGYVTIGSVVVRIGDDEIPFSTYQYHKYTDKGIIHEGFSLHSDQRKWYGYPSQGLLVLTVPLDIGLYVIKIPTYCIIDSLL